MAGRSAIREQLRTLRLDRRLALALLATLLLIAAVVSPRWRSLLLALVDPAELRLLLPWGVAAVVLLVPIAGIVSLVSQYAFWEGWLAGLADPAMLFASPGLPHPAAARAAGAPQGYVIYLDGIHQYSFDHPPRVAAFLAELERRLGPGMQLLRGFETYTVMPVPLAEDRGGAWFWRRLFALQEHHPKAWLRALTAALVQANNIIKVGISSDRRYGPIGHYELALRIAQRLAHAGFHPDQGAGLVLLGYSGGAEMAFGVADYLQRLAPVPLRVITFCGVFSGNHPLERVSSIGMVVGSRDPVAAFGRIAYPGRSGLLAVSRWGEALRRGQVQRRTIAGMGHNGERGPFAEDYREPLLAAILSLLAA